MLERPEQAERRPECPEPGAAPKKRGWALRGKARKRRASTSGGRRTGSKLTPHEVISSLEIVERLGAMNRTIDELAAWFDVTQPTVNARFREYPALGQAWRRGLAMAQISTRRLLFNKAMRPTADGTTSALYLARKLLWPQDGDDGRD